MKGALDNVDLNLLIHSIAKDDENALKEIYDKYKVPFYFIALSVTKNDGAALSIAAEAFKRLRREAYRFEDELNAEYWLCDILYTLCYNKMAYRSTVSDHTAKIFLPDLLKQEPEVFIKAYTGLGKGEISALTEKKKSVVSSIIDAQTANMESIKSTAQAQCPEYWEAVHSEIPTGAEELPHDIKNRPETQVRKEKRAYGYKKILLIVILVAVIAGSVYVVINLIRKNYSADQDTDGLGEAVQVQFNNRMAMTELGGNIYFRGANNAFYKKNMAGGNIEKISDDYPKELLNDGEYVYYRNNHDGFMYRINPDGSGRTQLCNVPGAAMTLYKGELYFSTAGGIYRIPASGDTIENAKLVLDTSHDANLFCVDMDLDAQGNVYFSSGVGKGLHHITEYNGEPSVDGIFADEAYTIQIDGDTLYFDYKEMSGKIILYCFDLKAYLSEESGARVLPSLVKTADGKTVELATGAFYAKDGNVYYTGTSEGRSALFKLDSSLNVSELTKTVDGTLNYGAKLYITDLYVTGDWAYCFCSDGKSNGKRIFFAYDLNKDITVNIYES